MMHGRFHPDDITAAARLRVYPVPATGPSAAAGPLTPRLPAWAAAGRRRRTQPSFLDRVETRLWARPDARMRDAGWEVVRLGRWRRQYRHPRRVEAGTAAARVRYAAECAAEPRVTPLTRRPARTPAPPARRWAA
ncbi:hypothetical protein [Cryptosporangium minutisporangium]|uniref:Uncharacterized protein n=1 Tax=Cryptosporangium minutisporangium TaxID=113569 RepID=A0ABP6TAW6_9ACTN